MCGLAGFIAPKSQQQGREIIQAMCSAIAHRGPDDEGYWLGSIGDQQKLLALGHRRLSIIDLSGGHQPMSNEDGSVVLVFNGEIYNHLELRQQLIQRGFAFKSHSDTETLLHAYEAFGVDCVAMLRGMFAFALWDEKKQSLLLSRDHFGKKPLFVYEFAGGLAFGSEIKSLLRMPSVEKNIDYAAMWEYFSYRYAPSPQTLFKGVSKLPAGSYAVWHDGCLEVTEYTSLPDKSVLQKSHHDAPVETFMQHLDTAVQRRMMADVPFGAFLSGGIDSAAIVALMAKHSDLPVKTFSVGFTESKYSELAYAKTIADQFSTDHHELTVSHDALMEYLPKLIAYRDAPVAEPSDIPIYLLALEARKSVKMVLTGEGSDEVLAGYPKHSFERFSRAYQTIPKAWRERLLEPMIAALPYRFRRAKTAISTLGLDCFEQRMPRWFGALSAKERDQLVPALRQYDGLLAAGKPFDSDPQASLLRRILYFDQTSWLPDNLLERGDRMTMAASLEARMPFMDYELVSFISSLPDTYRLKGMTSKWLLRQGMQQLLPSSILNRPKVGFRVPVNEWFRFSMKDYLYEHLLGADSRTLPYYDKQQLQTLMDEHRRGLVNHEKTLWMLLNLELWHRSYDF